MLIVIYLKQNEIENIRYKQTIYNIRKLCCVLNTYTGIFVLESVCVLRDIGDI